ncbi:glycoside hydrolase family 127 protein [Paraflavitalea sp. CAU 1676]|uniref:glycoside hydrolase family 127 protein n=1 Tax=Paraflavitalea sp. CAU 1676 TaxID=3032598 RepID=UPI0023DC262C|nr:glycoside hydrolase family 127 protein [Paraflavitalea sp. CAU 1676]MDF2192792.1 glycoside hydrolase family 127 protein [Paraflavitalea sp. CAU 1676]
MRLPILLSAVIASLPVERTIAQTGFVVKDKVTEPVSPFLLNDVRVTGGVLKNAMDKDAAWLLSLEPDRFLHRFRLNAGFQPKGAIYGGWESRGVSGQSMGHYLSACALMYAAGGDQRFKDKVDYIVKELAECQAARKTGYVGSIPDEDKIWNEVAAGNIRSQGFDLNGGWVPWYTLHKVLAGLIDSYTYTGNKQAKEVAIKLSDWIDVKFRNLTTEQWQKMLDCEHGGMNEALANLYSITGNVKYLNLSRKFHHQRILDPLSQEKDGIHGVHANTQIPKIIGCARRYELTGDQKDHTTSDYFWNLVVNHYSYVVGGNSDHERFAPEPDKLSAFLSTNTTETCNSYNMLKLTRLLFKLEPKANYMDFYERTLYNHILASQNPEDGMVLYYLPLVSGGQKKFNSPTNDFWCCTGTGMENHAKYGQDIYYKANNGDLYINLFIPSTLNWKEKQAQLEMVTAYPEQSKITVRINKLKATSKRWAFRIRKPWWAKDDVSILVNNKPFTAKLTADHYLVVDNAWKAGDVIELSMPMGLYTESMPDNKSMKAFLYGPLVLAGRLGTDPVRKTDLPVFVAASDDLNTWVKPAPSKVNNFAVQTSNRSITLSPLYNIYDERYAVYWNFFSKEAWKEQEVAFEQERRAAEALDKRTLDNMRIGEMQPERDHDFAGERTNTGEVDGIRWRDAVNGGWFSFALETKGATAAVLQTAYWKGDGGGRDFDILVDGVKIATEQLKVRGQSGTYSIEYPIPATLLKDKSKVTVKFQALPGKTAGGLFGCRLLKAE